MFKSRGLTILALIVLVLSAVLVGCATAAPTSPAAQALLDAANSQKTATAEAAASGGAATAAGLMVGDKSFSLDDLAGMEQATATTDDGDVTGASLLAVLSAAGITDGTLAMTASDGYSAEVAFSDIDATAVLATVDGKVNGVIPTLPKGKWVKDIVSITVQ